MTNFAHGQQAESAAADFLKRQGYAIVAKNWRTRFCEIDIIAQKHAVVYFCEVKYRENNQQGHGLDYITPQKLKQMGLAAEAWVHFTHWQGEYQLLAIEVSGPTYEITACIDDL